MTPAVDAFCTPLWLDNHRRWLIRAAPKGKAIAVATLLDSAVQKAHARGADFDHVWREIRLGSIIPLVEEAVGDGDEKWQKDIRSLAQYCRKTGGWNLNGKERFEPGCPLYRLKHAALRALIGEWEDDDVAWIGQDWAVKATYAACEARGEAAPDPYARILSATLGALRGTVCHVYTPGSEVKK